MRKSKKQPAPKSATPPVKAPTAPVRLGGTSEPVDLANMPRLLGGDSDEVITSRPAIERAARLQKMTVEEFVERVQMLHGVRVVIVEWPSFGNFFLVAGEERNFKEEVDRPCCNCGKMLAVSGDAPDNAVPICMRCVAYQAILARAHGVVHMAPHSTVFN